MKNLLLPFCFVVFALLHAYPQNDNSLEVMGKVVEISSGRPVGLPDIKVRVKGFGWAFTDKDGNFKITLPADKEYVTFELEGCPHPVVSPYNKLVNIPPNGMLDIKVCAAENKKLQAEIEVLNQRIHASERHRAMSKRQLAAMHQTLLDTVLHFEYRIAELENELDAKTQDLAGKDERIVALEKQVETLQADLLAALEEKYLRQQQHQLDISSCMENYLAKLKDLRDWLIHFDDYFKGQGPQLDFSRTNKEYEKAWESLNLNHANYLLQISNYWDDALVKATAEEVFQNALQDIHHRVIVGQYNPDVIGKLQELYGQPNSNKLRKEAKNAALETISLLNGVIPGLEEQYRLLKRQMILNI